MFQFRDFTPSEDVLNAIRSLRAEDDGMEPLERDGEIPASAAAPEASGVVGKTVAAKYDFLTPGRYLRARA